MLWCLGLVASRHVGSSWTRDWSCVSCIGSLPMSHQGRPKLYFYFLTDSLFIFGRSEPCGILVSQSGIEPLPLAMEAWSLNCWTTREVKTVYKKHFYMSRIFLKRLFNKNTRQNPKPQLLPPTTTCQGATKPMHHNYWACAPEAANCNEKSHHNEKPAHCNWRVDPAHCNREKPAQKWRASTAKNKLKF